MYIYDPATISPVELPICHRARHQDKSWKLWGIPDAKSFCLALLEMRETVPFDFTTEEWQSIEAVAGGDIWPVPDHPYTREDWHRDQQFSAAPGQKVTEEIYDDMLNVLPPYSLPRCKRTENLCAGFMVSEAVSSDPRTGKQLYSAFGRNRRGFHYFIGLLPVHPGEEE